MSDISEDIVSGSALRSIPPQSTALNVLVVESDIRAAEELQRNLCRSGHSVQKVGSGCQALEAFHDAELVLIDLDLPDLDGLEVCRSIRAISNTPVIAVTKRGSELDCVLCLRAGADDYLATPYGFHELTARMEAVMRRIRPRPAPDVITHYSLYIDASARQVTLRGEDIQLTRKEFQLLHLLASHPGAVVTRKQIMSHVWGDTWSRRTLDTHVSSLRGKLGNSDWIITVRGIGFRLGNA